MLVAMDSEFGYRSVRHVNGRAEPDTTTGEPVCACLAYEDGREETYVGDWDRLGAVLSDDRYTFILHGFHAEQAFCRMAGIQPPGRYVDTLLRGVLVAHATEFKPLGGAYSQAGLATLAARFGIPFLRPDDKDIIRESILHLRHREEHGMPAVLAYCMGDARACLRLVRPLEASVARHCGPNAERNLARLFQPYARAMATVAARGLRFDTDGWDRLVRLAGPYRDSLVQVMRKAGYRHDGDGLGHEAFKRMVARLGLERGWPRTLTGRLRTQEPDLKNLRHLHPAIRAAHSLVRFNALIAQRLGDRVDRDGRLRCGILPLAQRAGRNSTVRPNLGGLPGGLRPLLLPDEGCRLVHFDFTQQEPAVTAALTGDERLFADFAAGDVYVHCGRRMGLVTPEMAPAAVRAVRNELLKVLVLSVLYAKSAAGVARDLRCSMHEARVHLARFEQEYPRLFRSLRAHVSASMQRGWAENVIGFRAAFNVRDRGQRAHVARSCQNFVVQSSAAAYFQVAGLHLAAYGADIRLPIHDAYLLNVPDDPHALAEAQAQIAAATEAAANELFPGLPARHDVEVLSRFAKDGQEDSLDNLLATLMKGAPQCPAA